MCQQPIGTANTNCRAGEITRLNPGNNLRIHVLKKEKKSTMHEAAISTHIADPRRGGAVAALTGCEDRARHWGRPFALASNNRTQPLNHFGYIICGRI